MHKHGSYVRRQRSVEDAAPSRLSGRVRALTVAAALTIGLSALAAPSAADSAAAARLPASVSAANSSPTTVPPPSAERLLVGGTEALLADEATLGRTLDVVRVYRTWSPTSLPVLDLPYLSEIADEGRRSAFLSAVVPWVAWKAEADRVNGDGNPANDVPEPFCKWQPTDPLTGQPLPKSWFAAFADGDYDARLRDWLTQVDSLGDPDTPVLLSLMPEADRLDALPGNAAYQACVGTAAEFRAGWERAYEVAAGATGGSSLNLADGAGGQLLWVPVFTGWSFAYTAGVSAPERALVEFGTGLPPPGAPPEEATLTAARATPWLPAADTWDHVGIDEFNFSGAVAGVVTPTRVKVDDPATPAVEKDQWRSLEVLMRPVLLWSEHNAPRPDDALATVFLAEVGSVPDPTRPERRPDWLTDACRYLQDADRIVGALYFDANTVRLSSWQWTKRADKAWYATPPPTGPDQLSVSRWGDLLGSPRAGGDRACGTEVPPTETQWVGNPGVEESAAGWTGKYGANPAVTRTAAGHASDWAMTVQATATSPTGAGLTDHPRWLAPTAAGTTYTASAWVRTEAVGKRLVLQLREWDGATLVATQKAEWRATDTDWHLLTVGLTAGAAGSSISFAVYSPYLAAPENFSVDDFSLTSPN